MTSINTDGGGSFLELRQRHLGLFGQHGTQRPRRAPAKGGRSLESAQPPLAKPKRSTWEIIDILHFAAPHDDE